MTWLNNRVTKLEAALAVGALTGTKPRQIRLLLTEEQWAHVPVGSLIHIGGNQPRVYRFLGEFDPVACSFQGEEVDPCTWQGTAGPLVPPSLYYCAGVQGGF